MDLEKATTIDSDFYLTVQAPASAEIKVKSSLFIGHLAPAADREQAEAFINQIRSRYHNATHNCFAYRIDENIFRFSDDGEPSGTAGKPILSTIDGHGLRQIVLVVTRYFGGTKLGTGGLIRAYSQCAEQTIQNATIVKKAYFRLLKVAYPFSLINKVQHLAHKYQARIHQDASENGMIASISVLPSRLERFKEALVSETSGQIIFIN